MSLDLPIKEGYDIFVDNFSSEVENFFMVTIPEEVRSVQILPFGRINQIDQSQAQGASNTPYADTSIIQIDIWSTNLAELNELQKLVDAKYNSEGWKCTLTDLDEDKDPIFESVFCYRLIKRYKKNRLYK